MTDYKKNLGLKESTSIVISRIIGSGIFRTPAPIMALVGCTSLFGLVWVLGGMVTIFGAVVYAELTAMIPKSGGPYVFLKEAYGPYIAFLRGWAMFFVSETASIVAVSLVFTEFINAIFEIITGTAFGLFPTFFIPNYYMGANNYKPFWSEDQWKISGGFWCNQGDRGWRHNWDNTDRVFDR